MRYYDIRITEPDSGKLIQQYTSHPNGKFDPNALMVEMDIPVASFHTPMNGASFVRIWGIPLQQISQANDLFQKSIEIYGGMKKGLPLANPSQSGLLVKGTIYPAFGNWIGVDMTLDLTIIGSTGSPDDPKNIVLEWRAGIPLSQAISTTLSTAFPSLKQSIQISPNLVLPNDEVGFYHSMQEFTEIIHGLSKMIIGGDYPGVSITLINNTIYVQDGTQPPKAKKIAFDDLIGQPTWVQSQTIQVSCVMRADLSIDDVVTLPNVPAGFGITQNAGTAPQYRNSSAFQGSFRINGVRHVGNSRQPTALSWLTVLTLSPAA